MKLLGRAAIGDHAALAAIVDQDGDDGRRVGARHEMGNHSFALQVGAQIFAGKVIADTADERGQCAHSRGPYRRVCRGAARPHADHAARVAAGNYTGFLRHEHVESKVAQRDYRGPSRHGDAGFSRAKARRHGRHRPYRSLQPVLRRLLILVPATPAAPCRRYLVAHTLSYGLTAAAIDSPAGFIPIRLR